MKEESRKGWRRPRGSSSRETEDLVPLSSFEDRAWIHLNSIEDLREHEGAILERLSTVRNGGALFLTDPLRLLSEIGVRLTDSVETEIRRLNPGIAEASPVAYDSLKAATGQALLRVTLRGLFRFDE